MSHLKLKDTLTLPESAFEVTQHLGFGDKEKPSGHGMNLPVQY